MKALILASTILAVSLPVLAAGEAPSPPPIQGNPEEVSQIVAGALGQRDIQLAQAQALVNAQAREIDRLNKIIADKSVPKK